MRKIIAITVPVVVFILGFIFMRSLLGESPFESLYIIYLIAVIGVVLLLRLIYLKKGKWAFLLFLLYFLVMTLAFITVFALKTPIYISYILVIFATVFLIPGVIELFKKR
jgi:hypothetical protein